MQNAFKEGNNNQIEKNKQVLDSLSLEKANKTTEIKSLSAELDSLKKLRDSLNTISEK